MLSELERLDELIDQHHVPGAAVAVLHDGQLHEAAAGVLSTSTRVRATTDSVWQIGSVTKLVTAALVMQLVDDGLVSLDDPIGTHLEGFAVADAGFTASITVRQLLTHTSGIAADVADFGRGDDCVARYVEALRDSPLLFPPGTGVSYCNAGFIVLGRLVEVVRQVVWDDAVRRRVAERLNLTRFVTLPEEAIVHRASAGHSPGTLEAQAVWGLPRASGPAGAVVASAADTARFAAELLDGGRLLSSESARQMRSIQVPASPGSRGARGLGWVMEDWGGVEVAQHDGGTLGQLAYLRTVPATGTVFVLLTNGPSRSLYRALAAPILDALTGAVIPADAEPAGRPPPPEMARPCCGWYRVGAGPVEVDLRDGELCGRWHEGDAPPPEEAWVPLHWSADHRFLVPEVRNGSWAEIVFTALDEQGMRTDRLMIAGRAAPRIESPTSPWPIKSS